MCECSKGYTCPQHVARVNANAAGAAKQRKPKGMTIRQAVEVMKANRSLSRTFSRNKETQKAARILMGAYFSSGERGCPSFQQVFERFSQAVSTSGHMSSSSSIHLGRYRIEQNGTGYYVVYVKSDDVIRYINGCGEERTSCARNNLDGTGGYFASKSAAEKAVLAHKHKASGSQDDKWAKLVKELPMRSFTIERRTIAISANQLLRNVSTTEISEKIKDSGFKDVRPEHVHLFKPISEIGYYKILIKFNEFSKVEISLWVVPL